MSFSESKDGLSIQYAPGYPGALTRKIPKRLLQEMSELKIGSYAWERLLEYYEDNRDYTIESWSARDLIGMDLTGKLLRSYFCNWEDSEWHWDNSTARLEQDEDGYIVAVPVDEILEAQRLEDEWYESNDGPYVDPDADKIHEKYPYQHFQGRAFAMGDVIQVLTPRDKK